MDLQSAYADSRFFKPSSKKLYRKLETRLSEISRFLHSLNPSLEPVRKAVIASAHRLAGARAALENLIYYEGERASPYLSMIDINSEKYKTLEDIAKKLIYQEAKKYFEEHNVSSLFRPPKRPIRSFETAQRALPNSELGVVLTPKGLPYLPFFDLLGLETKVAMNGYPAKEGENKNILLVEDCTSKDCLSNLYNKIQALSPREIALFLGGKSANHLSAENSQFSQIHTPKTTLSKKERQKQIKKLIGLLAKKYPIFLKEGENF